MRPPATSDIFAGNRARRPHRAVGRGRAPAARRRATRARGRLAARALSRTSPASALEAVIVNTAGGIAGGDRFDLDIDGRRRRAARRHHGGGGEGLSLARAGRRDRRRRSTSAPARALAWLPQETILFDRRAAARARIEVDLAADARLAVWPKPSCSAAPAMGETVRAGRVARPLARAARRPARLRRERCGSTARSRELLGRAGGRRRRRRDRDACSCVPGDDAARRGACARWRAISLARSASRAWNGIAVARLVRAATARRCGAIWSRVLDARSARRRCRGSGLN